MRDWTIEKLAYRIKQAKDKKLPQPIVFLGAGASKTGEIPLAGEIVTDILDKYKDNPEIKDLKDEDKNYAKLMDFLTPFERNELLKGYIDRAKINVTHIYLAQLIKEGFVDYVLTVNFDNLMLRALALYNIFPPTYDMAILKDLTTTNFKETSVVYLHGQHHGLWLLNTKEEMDKVREYVPPILSKISNQRPWIFIGYSGEDPIFNHVVNLGRFDNGLYWVCYKENNPCDRVCTNLLDKPNTNTFIIKGYDSDSFMLKLNQELGLPQPLIIDKPFTSLKSSLENIVDIDDEENFKGVKKRLEIVKTQVNTAINQFERGVVETEESLKEEIDIDQLKKVIINKIINKDFNEIEIAAIEERANQLKDTEINEQLANLYIHWGSIIHDLAKLKKDETLCQKSIEKYEKAIALNPENYVTLANWSNSLLSLANFSKNAVHYQKSIEKSKKAATLNSNSFVAFLNWGTALSGLAILKKNEPLFRESFDKFEKATTLNPKYDLAFFNWGIALINLAKLKNDESLYRESFEKYEKATALNPKNAEAFHKWGTALSDLAKLKNDESLYQESFEKYEKSVALNSKDNEAFYNWGTALLKLGKLKNDELLYRESIEKFEKGVELGGSSYNLACAYALLKDKGNALKYLENSLEKEEETVQFVREDDDWKEFAEDEDFKNLLSRFEGK